VPEQAALTRDQWVVWKAWEGRGSDMGWPLERILEDI
jgi:hypothetical protein